jgi:hypothetical protein
VGDQYAPVFWGLLGIMELLAIPKSYCG